MIRFMSRVAALAAVGVVVASLASANVPNPELSTVPKCLPLAPNGGLVYTVRIVGTGGPIAASRVQVLFNTVGDSLVCWCNGTGPAYDPNLANPRHSFSANTNGSGVATFSLFGGGCIQNQLAAIPGDKNFAGEVFADFVKMQEFGTVSPDAVDNNGRLATATVVWNPGASCQTGLSDAVRHTTPLANATYAWCTDINCDRAVTLGDASILTPFLAQATSCAGGAGQ